MTDGWWAMRTGLATRPAQDCSTRWGDGPQRAAQREENRDRDSVNRELPGSELDRARRLRDHMCRHLAYYQAPADLLAGGAGRRHLLPGRVLSRATPF